MQVTTVSEFRTRMKEFMDAVWENSEEVIIAGPKGKSVVVISLEEYESMKETNYLLSSPANAARLRESKAAFEQGQGTALSLDAL